MSFDSLSLALLCVATVGHFGLWISLYNRINATGLRRETLKRIEKGIVLTCGLIPLFLLGHELRRHGWIGLRSGLLFSWDELSTWTQVYLVFTSVFAGIVGPFWIWDRPRFRIDRQRFELLETVNLNLLQRDRALASMYVDGQTFRRMAKLPGNQIVSLQQNKKRLFVDDLPSDLVGLRIAHLSDIHLTGQLSSRFYRLAIDWLAEQAPDLIVVSGDIVDYEKALRLIEPVFGGLEAPMGKYFILGNHDKRLSNPTVVCDILTSIGWKDLGARDAITSRGYSTVLLKGNERPWFRRHESALPHQWFASKSELNPMAPSESPMAPSEWPNRSLFVADWNIGVAHSPDQFGWGVGTGCQLLLCGHTHGGQIRLPIVGPIIAPSFYGSRYASGVFANEKTVMHVSTGISGIHPFRWGCMPEVSILELASRRGYRPV